MFRNYFKTAWRNLLKNKTFSVINVLGLAIGIASFLLIVNYLRFEYSFDEFNANKDRIYRVPMTVKETNGQPQTFAFTYPALAPAMKKIFLKCRKQFVSEEDSELYSMLIRKLLRAAQSILLTRLCSISFLFLLKKVLLQLHSVS
jgi:hypothetical protein